MLRDHTGAPRSLPVYLAMMWVPFLFTLVMGPPAPTAVTSVLAVVLIALAAGTAAHPVARRLMLRVLAALRISPQRTPPPVDRTLWRRRRRPQLLRELILAVRVGDPRAPAALV
ncbi:hypothetical protein [Gordonia sp. N1V]|uniref:hypothetical protein n=1 Tax=Gordonia sp. N1V TaxID=3034163 RepID=UPI0023E2B432|nr:hypothetical protein [Gordonia sp. N1V]